jgi:hypothetical protein
LVSDGEHSNLEASENIVLPQPKEVEEVKAEQ